jgi:hypothetical protein
MASLAAPGEDRNEVLSTLITAVGRNDPQAAIQLLQRQGSGWRNDDIGIRVRNAAICHVGFDNSILLSPD